MKHLAVVMNTIACLMNTQSMHVVCVPCTPLSLLDYTIVSTCVAYLTQNFLKNACVANYSCMYSYKLYDGATQNSSIPS